jgi:hypothetical protein
MKARTILFGLIIFLVYSCDNLTTLKTENTKTNQSLLSDNLSREELSIFSTLVKREILKRLFDNPQFDSSGMAIWKGNYSDLTSLSIPLSYDGKFHTSLDTILYFFDTRKRNCAVAIFSTYNFQHDPFDSSKIRPTGCHFCGVPIGAALFHETEKKNWELYDFKKEITHLGYGGIYKTERQDEGKIRLKEIGDRWTSLSITEGLGGNMGYLEGGEMLFSVEENKLDGSPNNTLKILLTNYYTIKETFLSKKILPEIRLVKKQDNYYDLVVRTIDNETVKTKRYKYSPNCERYLEQMH